MLQGNWRAALAVASGLIAMQFTGDLAKLPALPAALDGIPYLRSGISYLFDIAIMVGLLRLLGGVALLRQMQISGLGRSWRPAAVMGLCLFVPIVLAGAIFGSLARDSTWPNLLFLGVLAPFAEELTYRGLGTGVLLAIAGWRFWPAALLPAALFGLVHVGQGEGLTEIAMVVALTAVGGVFFSWLYVRFGHNLWPPIVMHVGMNSLWNLFDLGDNAVGGVLGNLLRAASVAGAIAFALWGRYWLNRVVRVQPAD